MIATMFLFVRRLMDHQQRVNKETKLWNWQFCLRRRPRVLC